MEYNITAICCMEISASVLAILLILCSKKSILDSKYGEGLFKAMVWLTVTFPLIELASYVVMGLKGEEVRYLSIVLDCLDYIGPAAIGYLWARYTDSRLYSTENGIFKHKITSFPFMLEVLLILSSPITGLVFNVGADNEYVRGPLMVITYIIPTVYILMSLVEVFVVSRKKPSYKFYPFVYFAVISFIGMAIQAFVSSIAVLWMCSAIALTMTYVQLQNELRFRDSHTGLFNREQLLDLLDEAANGARSYVGIMADIDYFKKINDTWGHGVGDYAIEEVVHLLLNIPFKRWVTIRYSSDEFILLNSEATIEEAREVTKYIDEQLIKRNSEVKDAYTLSLSMGIAYMPAGDITKEQFIAELDTNMNKRKDINHAKLDGVV